MLAVRGMLAGWLAACAGYDIWLADYKVYSVCLVRYNSFAGWPDLPAMPNGWLSSLVFFAGCLVIMAGWLCTLAGYDIWMGVLAS